MGYYIVEVYSGRDADAADALANCGFLVYRPTFTTARPHRRYKGVTVTSISHLMPGYIFLEVPPSYISGDLDLNAIYQTDYVLSVLGMDEDHPFELDAVTVTTIRKLAAAMSQGISAEDYWKANAPSPTIALLFEANDKVRCQVGTQLLSGLVMERRGRDRYLVELKVAGRLKRVKVTSAQLEAA